jgi:hypothetical protein
MWTPHDLRRTASTMMQALGVSLDVIDRCQNHVIPGSKIRRHYMHHDYAREKSEAWQKLGSQIDVILQIVGVDEEDRTRSIGAGSRRFSRKWSASHERS